ncbi:hypothetical protein GGR52DRAFT_589853 [Hypoxylon sp. FL1284]|nr:hypothetical protein GGR52DRAFT_589853 [Hypoxylon sp. FL1284]
MRPTTLLPILSTLAAAAPTPEAAVSARDAPSPSPRVASVSYSGSGCPSSAPAVERSGGFDDMSLRMKAFEATPAASVNCQAHLLIAGSAQGWQVAVRDVSFRGHLVLDPGASLDYYVTSFWSQDADKTSTVRGTFSNSGSDRLTQDVTAHGSVPDGQIVYSPCVGSGGDVGLLNVNFRVALQADGAQYGYFGKGADENWSYVWRRC